ncbi:MAG: RNA 2',3'-cyclic phosphodiesterase [Planctomycetales bacterium]|nr:RNA 2',3'-cyclic phosphodiesterase [Planctomycetales bacterium]
MARIRTFVAVEISEELRRAAKRVLGEFSATQAPVRWVDPGQFHVTLKFLGDVDDSQIYAVCAAVRNAAAQMEPFVATCDCVGAFPKLESPRTVWLGISEGTEQFRELHQQLDTRLSKLGFPHEQRQFAPHITLGRVDRDGQRAALQPLVDTMSAAQGREFGQFLVTGCVVYSSELTPRGPVYTPLGKLPLGG